MEEQLKFATMILTMHSVMENGLMMMLLLSATSGATTILITVCCTKHPNHLASLYPHCLTLTGAEASQEGDFVLSHETPITMSLECSGEEDDVRNCPGYNFTNANVGECVSGHHQAGIRCIEGRV